MLRKNYPEVKKLLTVSTKLYNDSVNELLNIFRVCLIIRIVCNISLNMLLLWVLLAMFRLVEGWLQQCMEMIASTPTETSLGCVHYYKRIKEEMKGGQQGKCINTELDDYVPAVITYRMPHTKGTLSPWYRNPLLLAITIFCFNEIFSTDSFKLCDYYLGFSGFNDLMADSQASLI